MALISASVFYFLYQNQQERDVMMNTVAPVWDGNETWMVLGGAGLFAAFPIVYSRFCQPYIYLSF
jgi:cytochrome d ubiquinol oxidase subunit II